MSDPMHNPMRNHVGLLAVVFVASLLRSNLTTGCIYSATECQCALRPSGNVCLRYHSGAPGEEECKSYICGQGYHCDCSGTHVCDITNCARPGGSAFAFRPRGRTALSAGQLLPCERYRKTRCAVPRGLLPSASPTPSSSVSPMPSSSVLPTPSSSISPTPSSSTTPSPSSSASPFPSSSSSPTPSASASAFPSVSASSSVTPSPSPLAVLPLGAACAPPVMSGTTCARGLACDCAGVCARKMELEIRAVGDDYALPYVCGKAIKPRTKDHLTPAKWTYSGACVTHVIFETYNKQGLNGVGAGLRMDIAGIGQTGWVSTRMDGGGMVALNPKDRSFLTDARFDFKNSREWQPVVKNTLLLKHESYRNFLASIGKADLWAFRNTYRVPKVKVYYMMPNPKCPKRW